MAIRNVGISKLLLLLVVVAILPSLGMVIYSHQHEMKDERAHLNEEVRTAAALARVSQENMVTGVRNVLETLASGPAVRRKELRDLCPEFLGTILTRPSNFANIGFADLNGDVTCVALAGSTPTNVADRHYFRRAAETQQFAIGNFMIGRVSQKPTLGFGMPVMDPSNQLVGIAFVSMDLQAGLSTMQGIGLDEHLQVDVLDRDGLLLASNHAHESAIGALFADPAVIHALPDIGPLGLSLPNDGNTGWIREIRNVGQASNGAMKVVVSARLDDSLEPIVARLNRQLQILAFVSVLGLLMAWYLSYWLIIGPLNELHRRMELAALDGRAPGTALRTWTKEFAELDTGFRQLLWRLKNKDEQVHRAQRLAGMGFYVLSHRVTLNDTAAGMLGLGEASLEIGLDQARAMVVPEDLEALRAHHKHIAASGEEGRLIFRVRLPDGRLRWIEEFCLRQSGGSAKDAVLSGAWQDVSRRQRLQRMFALQSQINEMLLGATRVSDILQKICDLAVTVGGMRMTLFVRHDEASGQLEAMASAAQDQADTDLMRRLSTVRQQPQPEALAAIRSGGIQVANDLSSVPEPDAWTLEAIENGYRSAMAAPVFQVGRIYGTLIFLTTEIGHFESHEQQLLSSIARSVSGALDVLDAKEERLKAEIELKLLQRSVDNLNDVVIITEAEPLDEPGPRIIYVNRAFERVTGYSAAEVIGKSPRILQRAESRNTELQRVGEALKRWQPVRAEVLNFTKDGEPIWLDMNIVPLEGNDGLYTHWVAVERDISEQRSAQEKEKALLDSFRLLFEGNPQPMWVFDVHTRRFLHVNHAACEQYGYTLEEFRSLTIYDIRSPAEKARLQRREFTNDGFGRDRAGVWQHTEKSGRIRYVDITSQRLTYEGKEAELVVAIDLSERVRVEAERENALITLERTAARLDRAQSLALMGSWERSVDDGTATWSRALYQIMGRDPSLGPPTLEDARHDAHPDDVERYLATMADAVAGNPVHRICYRCVHPDGSVHSYEETFDEPLRDADGRVRSISGTVQDITHRVEAEKTLQMQLYRTDLLNQIARATEERRDLESIVRVVCEKLDALFSVALSTVFLRSDDGKDVTVAHVGLAGTSVALKAGIARESTWSIEESGLERCMEGEPVYEPDLSVLPFSLPQALASAGQGSLVLIPLQSRGEVFGALMTTRPEVNGFDSGACEFMRQLGEHVSLAASQGRLLESLKRAYTDLQEAQQTVLQQERLRVLGHMASGIAHDINNALSPVALYTEALLMLEDGLSLQGRQQLQTIQLAVDDVSETVARLREFYRPANNAEQHGVADLNRIVHQTVDLTRVRWRDLSQELGRTIEIDLTLMDNCPPVLAAEGEVRDALVNLVLNACDAMSKGGILSITTQMHRDETEDVWLEVSVTDTGSGMDTETRARCIEPFFTTKGERGTGLGLAMVFGCMKRHSGSLHIDSEPGKGTRVTMRFPEPSKAAQLIKVDPPDPIQTIASKRLKILVIDDEPQLRSALSETLEMDGHEVICVSNGQDGLKAFHAAMPDVPFSMVITDLGMPGMDGREVAARIKSASATTPVVMLTGWGRRMEDDKDIPPGVDQLISKPPTRSVLLAVFTQLGFR